MRDFLVVATLFNGHALCGVDESGKLHLPTFVTRTLQSMQDRDTLVIGRHERDACLTGYPASLAPRIHADLERRRIAEEAVAPDIHHMRSRRAFGLSEHVGIDGEGRLALPLFARRRAGIDRLALIVGAGPVFEIWDPEQARIADDAELRALADWHLELQHAA